METNKQPVRIQLNDEQREQIREATGKDTPVLEFTVEELEERIAPIGFAKVAVEYKPQYPG